MQCNATFDGMQCEQDINHHRKCGKTLKHNFRGQGWTNAGAADAERRKEKEERNQTQIS